MAKKLVSPPPAPFTPPPPGYLARETRRIAAKYFRLRSGQLPAAEAKDLRAEIAADERDLAYVKERTSQK